MVRKNILPNPSSNHQEGEAPAAAGIRFDPAELESPPPTTTPDTPDPFDPSTYKVRQNLSAAAGVKNVLTELAVTTPNKSWWVRRHPNPEYALNTWVIELRDEQETYLVLPHLWPSLMGEATFKPKTFYLAVTMQGKPFLWGIRRPVDDTKEPDRWMRAPLAAVALAKDKWTRITWNEITKQHDVATCESAAEPKWPDLSLKELLKLAFKGFIIDEPDHPVLRRLRGEM
jgi:hypothetical protein